MSKITQTEFEQTRMAVQRKLAGPWTWSGACNRWERLDTQGGLVASIYLEAAITLTSCVGNAKARWVSHRHRQYAQAWADLTLIAQGYALVDPITFTMADQLGLCDFV